MNLTAELITGLKTLAEYSKQLVFLPELGIGYYPVKESPYDSAYFQNYLRLDNTPAGADLTRHRRNMLIGHTGPTIDVGIGGGRFVNELNCYGYDINPDAIEWLKESKRFKNPSVEKVHNLTFWDSLEHIHNPGPILDSASKNVFISMPIYTGSEHVLRSKHFRKDEHCWYFTDNGLKLFMQYYGFEFVSSNTGEQPIREDIVSYHFRRIK